MIVYIRSLGFVTAIDNFDDINSCNDSTNVLRCIEPDYKKYISPIMRRKMNRITKMGIVSAHIAFEDAKIENPDAIILGTGMGALEYTERFLTDMVNNSERLLNPTYFINSTHNTMSSQIAIHFKCSGYNSTYSHRSLSFESALLDARLLLKEGLKNVLVSGVDELSDDYLIIKDRFGSIKKKSDSQKGSIPGEGAISFYLTAESHPDNLCKLLDTRCYYDLVDSNDIKSKVEEMLSKNNMSLTDIDVIIHGVNGDSKNDLIYNDVIDEVFNKNINIGYKALCGEYHTSTAFALSLSAYILKNQSIPSSLLLKNNKESDKGYKNILIYNHYKMLEHSFSLVQVNEK